MGETACKDRIIAIDDPADPPAAAAEWGAAWAELMDGVAASVAITPAIITVSEEAFVLALTPLFTPPLTPDFDTAMDNFGVAAIAGLTAVLAGIDALGTDKTTPPTEDPAALLKTELGPLEANPPDDIEEPAEKWCKALADYTKSAQWAPKAGGTASAISVGS